jgi:hypothetical protein
MLNNKKALMWGAVFGFAAPFIGLFIGLQVSPTVANIFMFPILGLSAVLGSPFGMWSPMLMFLGLAVSIVVWAFVFVLIGTSVRQVWK